VDNFTGGAGNDTFTATGTTLSALDGINGGAGTDTLVIRDAAGVMGTTVPAGMTIAVERIDVNTAGALGQVNATATAAQREIDILSFSSVVNSTGSYTVTWSGLTVITAATDVSATKAESAILVANAINSLAGPSVASAVGEQVVITAPVAGTALPTYTVVSNTNATADITNRVTKGDSQPNQAAVAGSTAATYDLTGVVGLTDLTARAAGNVNVKLADTTDASITTTTGSVMVEGGRVVTTSGVTGPVNINGAAGLTTVSVTGATTVTIADSGTEADTLTSVSISGATGASTVASDALTRLTVANSGQGVTVNALAATRALDLTVNNLSGGTIQDATATTLNITASGVNSANVTVDAGAATTVSIAADEALTLSALNVGAATSLTVTGDSRVTLSAAAVGVLTSIDASAQTAGGVDISAINNLGLGVAFTGGAGEDSIQLGASTRAITTGAGDDTVHINQAALGANGSVDAGAGTDTLSMSAAHAATASNAATFEGTISGFERFALVGAAGNDTIKLANLDDINHVTIDGVNSGNTLTLTGATTGITLVANSGAVGTVDVQLASAVGTADVLNVNVSNAANKVIHALTATGFETINFATDNGPAAATVTHTVTTLTAANATTITVAGDAGLTFTTATSALALTSFDASGVTRGAVTFTTGNLTAEATLTGGAGNDAINASAVSLKSVTLNGGAGDDTLTGGAIADLIDGGAGNDSLVGNDGNDIINGGAGDNTIAGGNGNDTITGGAGIDSITGGAGNDVIVGGGGADIITGGAGADTITLTGNTATIKLAAADEAGNNNATIAQPSLLTSPFDVIFGATAGVKIDLNFVGAATSTGTLVLNGTNFAGQNNAVVFTNGTFDAAAGIFNFAANGRDTVVTFDTNAGTGAVDVAFESIILVGFDAGANTTAASGIITLG